MELSPLNSNPYSHLTAKERDGVSFPTRWLTKNNLIQQKTLDFGCGFGKDVEFLNSINIDTIGYDKFYFPDYPTEKYDTIICNYVLNVLLPEEQSEVIMSVSELLNPLGKAYFTVRRDVTFKGFRTHKIHQKKTYQCNVVLPFKSIFKNEYCEIYEYQHYNQIYKESECIFCKTDAAYTLVSELATIYSIYDKYPVSEGHTLVIPKRHSNTYFDLQLKEQIALWIMVNRVKKILTQKFKPDGFNVGFNVSESGGQTIFHTHIHVIPRYKNDVPNPKGGIRNVIPEKADYTKLLTNLPKNTKTYNSKKTLNNVLVAIINNKKDFLIAQNQNWYRIPVDSAPKNIREGVNLKYLAFYQTKVFENEKYTIRWYAEIKKITILNRKDLFPDEIENVKSNKNYYKIEIENLKALPEPIISKRNRRITFIPTTEDKFFRAKEINYLFNDSIIEDKFWEELLKNDISAERQYFLSNKNANFFLDFAIFCKERNIDIECDGDTYHLEEKDVKKDKIRNNEIESLGWSVLRFTTYQIDNEPEKSIDLIKETINRYGGMLSTDNPKKSIYFPKEEKGQVGLF